MGIDKSVEKKIINEQKWISRHVCINYDPNTVMKNIPMDDMVELVWGEVFQTLKDNNELRIEAILWCGENCKGLIYANRFSGRFEFELEKDVVAFKLRWI